MIAVSSEFHRALRMCWRWRVEVVLSESEIIAVDHDAPTSTAGIDWKARRIVWAHFPEHDDAVPALLHELAHCLDPEDPERCLEVEGPFLATEYALHRALGVRRADWMHAYGLGGPGRNREWGEITTSERGKLLQASRAKAIAWGTLDEAGRLTYRRPWEAR